MKNFLIIFCFLGLLSCKGEGQEIDLHKLCHLDDEMQEISGIEVFSKSDLIWGINDSGNKNRVYGIDKTGNIAKEVEIENTKNADWEDLAKDSHGTLFIGDFGNNHNKRKNLVIYKVKDFLNQSEKAKAEKIKFSLEDQTEFPPDDDHLNFGIESFFWKSGSLYLFTKNRSDDMDGTVKLYKLPDKAGTYKAKKIGSFKTCADHKKSCWITSATINKEENTIYLLSNTRIWVFTNFNGDDFFSGDVKTYFITGKLTQKEGIAIKGNIIYISDEDGHHNGQNIYEYSFSEN